VAAASTDFSAGDTVFVADGPLNVRSEATLNGTKTDSLPTGTSMTITDGPVTADGHTWWQIDTGDVTGWVAGEFLSADNPGGFGVGDNVVVFDGPLNVRESASIDADIITKLDEGDEATITDGPTTADGYDWYEIEVNGDSPGWIAGAFISLANSDSGSTAEFSVGDAVRADVDGLNLRADAGLDAEILSTVDVGSLFRVDDGPVSADGYTWYKVFNYFYGEGWVAGELVSLEPNGFPAEE